MTIIYGDLTSRQRRATISYLNDAIERIQGAIKFLEDNEMPLDQAAWELNTAKDIITKKLEMLRTRHRRMMRNIAK